MERHPLEHLVDAIERKGFTDANRFHFCDWLTRAAQAHWELERRVAELERRVPGDVEPVSKEDAPTDGPDYEAAERWADGVHQERTATFHPGKETHDQLMMFHAYKQGLAARLTPEERETIRECADILHDDNLRAIAGKGAK